ncbi:MAG: AsmA family protein, partial [Acidobacteriota bacterium]|nr:AsmA family protein [Acidobacteriota bacterium]
TVGSDRASLDGVLGELPALTGLDAAVELAGPSFAALGRFAAALGLAAPQGLAVAPYSISGRTRRLAEGFELDPLRAEARGITLVLEGIVGSGGGLRGTDLRLAVEAPDAARLSELTGVALPNGALEIRGHLTRGDRGFASDGIAIAIGDARAQLAGTLGERPDFEGTDLRLDISVPDLAAVLGPHTGGRRMPAEPFELNIELAGSAGQLASKSFSARLGANDLSGRLAVRFAGRPQVEAELRSQRLDLQALFADVGAGSTNESSTLAEAPETARGRLLPDEPLSFAAFDKLDATVRFEAGELVVPGPARREVVFAGSLRDGVLRVDRFEGSGILGGRTRASLTLEPTGNGYRMHLLGRLDGGRFVVAEAQESRESAPKVDLEVDLRGEGRSLHEIAASSSGYALVVAGPGRIQFRPEAERRESALRELVDALTPLRTMSDHTMVECGIALAMVSGGEAEVEPIAARTEKVNVTGVGWIDFATEEIDLSWRLKERRVTRISTGELVNSYIKLGGTLASPSVELKPLEALTSVAAAVATAGLTTVSKGVWNRLTADGKVCARALEEARRRLRERDRAAAP